MPEFVQSLARPLELAGTNTTLIQIVVPYVLDTLETYMLTPDDLPWMTQLESVNQATDLCVCVLCVCVCVCVLCA